MTRRSGSPVVDCSQPSIFSCFFFSIDERAMRTDAMDASAKRGVGAGSEKDSLFFFCSLCLLPAPSPRALMLALRARFVCFFALKNREAADSLTLWWTRLPQVRKWSREIKILEVREFYFESGKTEIRENYNTNDLIPLKAEMFRSM